MSAEHDDSEIFKDVLSIAILERYSTAPRERKRMAKRSRKSAQTPTSPIETGDENTKTNPAELAEFIEVMP